MLFKNQILSTLSVLLIITLFSCSKTYTQEGLNVKTGKVINVGVYNGNGASPICVLETMEALKIDRGINPKEISANDIMNGDLEKMDAIVFPGGSGSKEFNSLGQMAAEKVREFGMKKDKGIVGICAGGYLLSTTPTYENLKVLGVPHTRKYYDRGRGLIGFSLTGEGKKIFYELKNIDSLFVQYYDGPMFESTNGLNVLATINTDIATHKGYPHNFTQGKPAFFTKKYGQGKVFVSVGHPEATAGIRWIVPRMVRWVTNNKLISYSQDLIRPELNDKDILFYSDTKKLESKLFWQLSDKNPKKVLKAIKELHKLRSRPSIRWSIGLLRHKDSDVRLTAARYLFDSEYTAAIPDLRAAVKSERNEMLKNELQAILTKMEGYVK